MIAETTDTDRASAPTRLPVAPSAPAPRRRRRAAFGLGLGALAVAGAIGAVVFVDRGSDDSDATDAVAPPTTAEVQQRTITLYDETTATLEFTSSVTVSSPVEGTVTSLLAEGDTIRAGDVIATVDGEPVVALVGDVPVYRDLSTSEDDGVDVRQLELNLVSLGYDPDGEITIDETYDDATADAVGRWELELGLDDDGEVPEGRIVYVPGELLVDEVSTEIGSAVSTGGALVVGRETERIVQVPALAGDGSIVTGLAAEGTPVETGTVLFWNGVDPVVAIVGDAAAVPALGRDLSLDSSDGSDVELLESMLRDGGFDPDGAMTVDDEFDAATVAAVLRWRQALGAPYVDLTATDATVPTGSFVVVPSGLRVGEVLVDDGTPVLSDAVVLHLTTAARQVNTSAPLGDDTFAVGASMAVEYPDGSTATGTVVEVGTTATNASGTPGETPTVPIVIEVDTIPESTEGFVQIPVTLRVVTTDIPDALVVPVSALVALAEGGYAVERVTGTAADGTTATELVAVETGVFSDGFVEVTSDALESGQTVVVPS